MNPLQNALKINALFSIISGVTTILFNRQIANIFGVSNQTIFIITGILLVFFSFTILYEIKRLRKLLVLWIIIQDCIWVIASLFLIISNPYNVTFVGNVIIGVIAIIVLYMAINQYSKLRKQDII